MPQLFTVKSSTTISDIHYASLRVESQASKAQTCWHKTEFSTKWRFEVTRLKSMERQ